MPFIHFPSIVGHLGCFHSVSILNGATMNMNDKISL